MEQDSFYVSAEVRLNTTNSLLPGLMVVELPSEAVEALLTTMLDLVNAAGRKTVMDQLPTWKLFQYWNRRMLNSTGYRAAVAALRALGVAPMEYIAWPRIRRAAYLAIHDAQPKKAKRTRRAR